MKVRNALASVALVSTMLIAGTACEMPQACEGLSASAQDKEAAANGYEVEREDDSGNTCELSRDGNSWEVDD